MICICILDIFLLATDEYYLLNQLKKREENIKQMRKYKTALGNISSPVSTFNATDDEQLKAMQKQSKTNDTKIMQKKYDLIQQQLALLKSQKGTLLKQLHAYRKVVLENGNIHQLLEMQHNKIFQMQTQLQILQNKYDKLLNSTGSEKQTEYAIKCQKLQQILANKQIEHQKQIAALKNKLMRSNASQLMNGSMRDDEGGYQGRQGKGGYIVTPIKNSRRLV